MVPEGVTITMAMTLVETMYHMEQFLWAYIEGMNGLSLFPRKIHPLSAPMWLPDLADLALVRLFFFNPFI